MIKKEKINENQMQPEVERKARSVTELSASEARKFFLRSKSYCKIDLPTYFMFDDLLRFISGKIGNGNPRGFYDEKDVRSRNSDELNHTIFNNKDGKYAWRPLQLVNPFLYIVRWR